MKKNIENIVKGAVILGMGFGLVLGASGCGSSSEGEQAAFSYNTEQVLGLSGPIIEKDMNGNGILDKFYMRTGKVVYVELDGEPVGALGKYLKEKGKL